MQLVPRFSWRVSHTTCIHLAQGASSKTLLSDSPVLLLCVRSFGKRSKAQWPLIEVEGGTKSWRWSAMHSPGLKYAWAVKRTQMLMSGCARSAKSTTKTNQKTKG